MAQITLQWFEDHDVYLFPQFFPDERNIVAGVLYIPDEVDSFGMDATTR